MKCGYLRFFAEEGEKHDCDNEATFVDACDMKGVPVCADHKCRCSVSFVELGTSDARRQIGK